MSGIWRAYWKYLEKYPLRTNMIQTGLIMGAGDVFSQLALERKSLKQFEPVRSVRFALIGTVMVGPTVRGWYLVLERLFGSTVSIKTTLAKVSFDQLCFGPIFTTALLSVIGATQGMNFESIKKKLDKELVDVILTGWKIWPACQLINFYFVPFLLRPLFVNVVAFFWNSYLAWKSNRS